MSPSVAPILDPPVLLAAHAHRGPVRPAGMEGYTQAMRLGADGILEVAATEDPGTVVLGQRPRRRRSSVPRTPLTQALDDPTLAAAVVAVVVDEESSAAMVMEQAVARGATGRIWLCSADTGLLERLRDEGPPARLLHICDPEAQERGAEAHAASLRALGCDGVMVAEDRATAGLSALMHRFGRIVVARGADYERMVARALGNGVDGVCGSDVEVLHSTRRRFYGGESATE